MTMCIYVKVGRDDRRQWELDAMAVNGKEVVVVEAKATLKCGDVKDFIEMGLKNVKTWASRPERQKGLWGCCLFENKNKS